jgi:hypothetical protein
MGVHVSEFMLSGKKMGTIRLTALTVHHTLTLTSFFGV